MLTMYARNWWALALRGMLAIIFGIVALVLPQVTLPTMVFLFGACLLTGGSLALVQGMRARQPDERWWALAIEGTIGIVVGALTFFLPIATTLVLSLWIAGWAVVTGILEIVAAIELRRVIQGEHLMLLGGMLSIIFGVLLIFFPETGSRSVAWLISGYAVIFGILLTFLANRLRDLLKSAWRAFKSGFSAI